VPFGSHHVDKGVERSLVVVKDEHVLPDVNQLLHDHVLALADELAFRFHDRLQKMEIFHVTAVSLDAVNEMLDHLVAQYAEQLGIVLKDGTNRLSFRQLK
jgi:hypothetical protein